MSSLVRGPQAAHAARRLDGGDAHPAMLGVFVVGIAMAVVVGHDGSPLWITVRLLVTGVALGAAIWVLQNGTGRSRGVVSFVVGLVGVGVGLGIGLPHLAKHDITLAAVAAVVALGCGLVLLVSGVVAVARSRQGWQRVGEVAAMIVVIVVWTYASAIAIAATNVPRTSLDDATPAEHGLAYENVVFRASDGVPLSGWYVPTQNRAAVVLLHGAGSTRSSVLAQAVVIARHGYGVLMFDARGHGRSGGRAMDFGWYGDADIGGAVSYLTARADVDPGRIGAVGMSMGGEEAVGAAASDPRIAAVVGEGTTGRVRADRAWLSKEYGLRGWLHQRIDTLTYGLADVLTDARPPIALRDAVAQMAPRRVLLIVAGKVADEAKAAAHIRGGSPTTVDVWEVPGAGHTAGLATHRADWEGHVVGFLDDALRPLA
jgi:dienelactone hydrolase